MNKALRHEEPDRIPVSDLFWGSFIERWRREMNLPPETDIYRYYDLDWQVTVPNMDPHISPFVVMSESHDRITVKTGFEATITKIFTDPMPRFERFLTNEIGQLADFEFDDPWDKRRYFQGGDNQLGGMGDGFTRNLPPWIETVRALYPDFAVYGSVCEGHEMLWRIIGPENVMLWSLMYPKELGDFIARINRFMLEMARAQIAAAEGMLDGMVIWGDVAYTYDLLFDPEFWRTHFKPGVRAIVQAVHEAGLPVIYHGCGNVKRIIDDFIEIGVDALNPLEAKAGLDVVDLRRQYGHRIGFCGNMNVMEWADCSREELKTIVLRKLNAARGGGLIFQSDHSVPGNISAANYDYVVKLVRQYGEYPLRLEDQEIPELF
ncbi:MAG: uroporphyrinogen decarboxylase family protein [Bacteroidales bacterium]